MTQRSIAKKNYSRRDAKNAKLILLIIFFFASLARQLAGETSILKKISVGFIYQLGKN